MKTQEPSTAKTIYKEQSRRTHFLIWKLSTKPQYAEHSGAGTTQTHSPVRTDLEVSSHTQDHGSLQHWAVGEAQREETQRSQMMGLHL